MSATVRYDVKYSPDSGHILAGAVRHDPTTDRQLFITQCDVTGHAIGAVALWLIAHDDGEPHQVTNRSGVTYELTSRVVTGDEVMHP